LRGSSFKRGLARAKLLEEGNPPLLPRAGVLRVAQATGIAAIVRIIIATYKLLARVSKVEQEIYYLASNVPSKGASIRF
jgi:predicted small integral membrane protein